MASYAGQQPTDGGSKKFLGVTVNNAGANEAVAMRGVNRAAQNAETVGDLVVAPAGVYATGQATMANSLPVAIASNQSAVAVSPAGVTAAGQAAMAASLPVVIASNQSAVPVAPQGWSSAIADACSVDDTATRLGVFLGGVWVDHEQIVIYNNGAATVYIGGSGVVAADGLPLIAGGTITLATAAALYGITAGATVDVRVLLLA